MKAPQAKGDQKLRVLNQGLEKSLEISSRFLALTTYVDETCFRKDSGGDGGLFEVTHRAVADADSEPTHLRIFNGQFSFHSYDEKLEDFLDSLGIISTFFPVPFLALQAPNIV